MWAGVREMTEGVGDELGPEAMSPMSARPCPISRRRDSNDEE